MSRWDLLKESLKSGRNTSSSASIHAFQGHQVIPKEKTLWQGFTSLYVFEGSQPFDYEDLLKFVRDAFSSVDTCETAVRFNVPNDEAFSEVELRSALESCSEIHVASVSIDHNSSCGSDVSIVFRNSLYEPIYPQCNFYKYRLPSQRYLYTREIPEKRKIRANDILSDKIFGVDNTGNICTWPSEAILLHCLLTVPWLQEKLIGKRILEIGGGQTALAGLGLACEGISSEMILTDGHPHCVVNQGVCIQCCKSKSALPHNTRIRNEVLQWSNYDHFPAGTVDVVIGSDCLFFKDFHDALVGMLHHILDREGVAILLQPSRGGSMELFKEKAETFFDIEQHVDYHPELSQQRDAFLQNQEAAYSLDRHYPQLLILRQKPQAVVMK